MLSVETLYFKGLAQFVCQRAVTYLGNAGLYNKAACSCYGSGVLLGTATLALLSILASTAAAASGSLALR